MSSFPVVEASIATLRSALESGEVTSEQLVKAYQARIDAYDRNGIKLNSVIVDNPNALEEARASDKRRAEGKLLGPLDGIPYTAKDSYMVAGLTVASGSPAFANLVAQRDAYTVARLRAGGAVCLGLTNMPPMANGGMQRGEYGRAESPYNGEWLTSAFGSGSSNGSGTSTGASFAAFGLAEESWSSGRAPASCNALCAYTPSRGVISMRGNWPLVPTMDVVVPHARSMADLLEVLDVVVGDDETTRGDFWRVQPWIEIPAASEVRPSNYLDLLDSTDSLAGKRFGVPKMYINADPEQGTGDQPRFGGPAGQHIETRETIMELWAAARADLEAAGAEVVEVDFPMVSNYDGDRPGAPTIGTRGLLPEGYLDHEILDLSMWSWNDFLDANGDPNLNRIEDVEEDLIFPHPEGALADRYGSLDFDIREYVWKARESGVPTLDEIPTIPEGLAGLEASRRIDLEQWMDDLGLDAVVFPAVADIGPADMDVNEASADLGWRNGVWVANGNLTLRHFGVPTVTVPMGTLSDIGMPVGLTIAGRAYDDNALLEYGVAFEAIRPRRTVPERTPELD